MKKYIQISRCRQLQYLFLLVIILVCCFSLYPRSAMGLTISVVPSPAIIGQSVTVKVTGKTTPPALPRRTLQIRFGDGSGWQTLAVWSGLVHEPAPDRVATIQHIYQRTGDYTIQVRSDSGRVTSPDPVSASLVVRRIMLIKPPVPDPTPPMPDPTPPGLVIDDSLPEAVLGLEYEYQFVVTEARTHGKSSPRARAGFLRFRIIKGRLPQKLRMDRTGNITGIPEKLGRFPFTLQATLANGIVLEQKFVFEVVQTRFQVYVSPDPLQVDRNTSGQYRLTYTFTADDPLNDALQSSGGTFWAGRRKIGATNQMLKGKLKEGRGIIQERLRIPLSVVRTVQRMGVREIIYKRTFTSRYMEAKSVSMASIIIGTGFSISKIHIYFDQDRAKLMVKRKERKIKAAVDITYDGAGLVKGYWQVDGRILARVQKHLSHGRNRIVTFTYPGSPPIPTYFIGSHRLRFVITEPDPRVRDFPFVIYVVSGEGLAQRNPIRLLAPKDNQVISVDDLTFRWKPARSVKMYLLKFFEADGEKSFFTAYAAGISYRIKNDMAVDFVPGKDYYWQINGFDAKGEPCALSARSGFHLVPADHAISQATKNHAADHTMSGRQ